MSAKLPIYLPVIDHSSANDTSSADETEHVQLCLRRIQADAERICTDADDIEDARFLAENIVDSCRQFLAHENATISSALPTECMRPNGRFMVAPTATENLDASSAATARAKLARLSARELEIFTHLAEGHSAAEIAETLSRSSKTINNHRTRILQKLGLKNAAELVRLALRSGLVSV